MGRNDRNSKIRRRLIEVLTFISSLNVVEFPKITVSVNMLQFTSSFSNPFSYNKIQKYALWGVEKKFWREPEGQSGGAPV